MDSGYHNLLMEITKRAKIVDQHHIESEGKEYVIFKFDLLQIVGDYEIVEVKKEWVDLSADGGRGFARQALYSALLRNFG